MVQNGASAAGYTVTPVGCGGGGGSVSNAAMRLDECQRGMLLNATSATSDVTSDAVYRPEVALPAAATVTPAVTAGDTDQRHSVQVFRQVRRYASPMKYLE